MKKSKLNPYIKKFWDNLDQINVLYGGRMSSKTMEICTYLLYIAAKYKVRILCLRRFQNKLSESVFSTFKTILDNDRLLAQHYNVTANNLTSNVGSEFIFYGIERNFTEIKGVDNIDITFAEESELITKDQCLVIIPTVLRKQFSFILFCFNPRYDTDFVYKEYVTKNLENVNKLKVNYINNPFLSESAKKLIEVERKKLTETEFNNVYLGDPLTDSDDTLIRREWLRACVDSHIKLKIDTSGKSFIGYDVADDGGDKNAICVRKGNLINDVIEWSAKENELLKSTQKVYNKALESNSLVIYDSIGVGASVGSIIENLNQQNDTKIEHIKFNAGAKVNQPNNIYKDRIKNSDMFSNLKAQAWWEVADRVKYTYNAIKGFYDTIDGDKIISIDSNIKDIDSLIIELSTPRKDFDNSGKVKIESKKDLAKRGISSPNKADAFIMCLYKPSCRNVRAIII